MEFMSDLLQAYLLSLYAKARPSFAFEKTATVSSLWRLHHVTLSLLIMENLVPLFYSNPNYNYVTSTLEFIQ